VRIARQRMPRLPRVVAVRPHPGAGGLLEGEEGSGAGQWGHASVREGAQGAAERPTVSGRAAHGQRQSSRTGEGKKTEEARGRGKKVLTCGPGGRGRRRVRGEGEGARAEEQGEWAGAWPMRGRKRERRERPAGGGGKWATLSFPFLLSFFFPTLKHSNKTI
jgi:hypothetical protein